MRHHLQQPLVVNRVKETADVGIEHPVHALAHDRCMQCIQRHVRVASWPEAIGEPAEVGLIDGTEHFSDRALDDLILQSGHSKWPFSAIGFGNVNAPHRLWPVATRVDSIAEIMEILLQSFFVLRHSHPIDTCACLPLLSSKCPVKGSLIDVMQQRGEPGLGSLFGRRVHPLEVGHQDNPALRPDPGLPLRNPLGLVPSLRTSRFLRRFHGYYEPVRLPTSARSATLAVPCC